MPRKKTDPRLAALLEKRAKAQLDCERTYARLARAFRRLEKHRKRLARLDRQVRTHVAPAKEIA